MQSKISRVIFVLYIIGLCFCCFWDFSKSTALQQSWVAGLNDKAIHFLLFFPYPIISYFAFPRLRTGGRKLLVFSIGIFITGAIIGLLTEMGQGMTDYRSKDWSDLAADCCGLAAAIACLMAGKVVRKRCRKE